MIPLFFGPSAPSKPTAISVRERDAIEAIPVAAASGSETRSQLTLGGFGLKLFSPLGAQDFHLRFERVHARGDAFIFFRGPVDRSIDRALTDESLKLFVNAQPQHFFPAAGSISFPKIKEDDIEQGFEFEGGPGRKHGHQFLGYVVGHPT
jgi:hypothetical protein